MGTPCKPVRLWIANLALRYDPQAPPASIDELGQTDRVGPVCRWDCDLRLPPRRSGRVAAAADGQHDRLDGRVRLAGVRQQNASSRNGPGESVGAAKRFCESAGSISPPRDRPQTASIRGSSSHIFRRRIHPSNQSLLESRSHHASKTRSAVPTAQHWIYAIPRAVSTT